MLFNHPDSYWKEKGLEKPAADLENTDAAWKSVYDLIREHHAVIRSLVKPLLEAKGSQVVIAQTNKTAGIADILAAYMNKYLDFKAIAANVEDIAADPDAVFNAGKPLLFVEFAQEGNSNSCFQAAYAAGMFCPTCGHIFITCSDESLLSNYATSHKNCIYISLPAIARGTSTALTSAFTSLLLAGMLCLRSEHFFSESFDYEAAKYHADHFLKEGYAPIEKAIDAANLQRVVFLGANITKGVSRASAAKTVELTKGMAEASYGAPSSAYSAAHPIKGKTLIVFFLSGARNQRQYDLDLAKRLDKIKEDGMVLIMSAHHDEALVDESDLYYTFRMGLPLDNGFAALAFAVAGQAISLMMAAKYASFDEEDDRYEEMNAYPFDEQAYSQVIKTQ